MKRLFTLTLLGLFLIAHAPAHATLVKALNLTQLTDLADAVVKVTVTEKELADDAGESGMIVTYYTLQVQEWIKGPQDALDEIVIKQVAQGTYEAPDGSFINQKFSFPEYEVGKSYVLFLSDAHPDTGLLQPIGLQQGVFEVKTVAGREVVPELNARARLLGLSATNNAALTRMLTSVQAGSLENTYGNFKSLIQAAR